MNTMRFALGFCLLVAGSACTRERQDPALSERAAARPDRVNVDSIGSEIRRLSEAHAKAAVEKDTDGVGGIFADDALYMPADDDGVKGGLRDIWRGAMGVKGLTIGYTPQNIKVAEAGDLAVERGTIANTMNGKPLEVGHYIYVWQPQGGEWKVTDYMWSTRPVKK